MLAGVVMSPCSPQSSREAALVRSLSTAALRLSAGGSMFARTGGQGNQIGFRVPEIRCMVEFNCTPTRLVCAD